MTDFDDEAPDGYDFVDEAPIARAAAVSAPKGYDFVDEKPAAPPRGPVPVVQNHPLPPRRPSDPDEEAFQKWYAERAQRSRLDPNPDAPEHKYDYRAARRAGAEPDSSGHWPSEFKADDHPNRYVDINGVMTDTKTGRRVEGPQPGANMPPVQELDDAQFRGGGSIRGMAGGKDTGFLTGPEAYAKSETTRAAAQAEYEKAQEAQAERIRRLERAAGPLALYENTRPKGMPPVAPMGDDEKPQPALEQIGLQPATAEKPGNPWAAAELNILRGHQKLAPQADPVNESRAAAIEAGKKGLPILDAERQRVEGLIAGAVGLPAGAVDSALILAEGFAKVNNQKGVETIIKGWADWLKIATGSLAKPDDAQSEDFWASKLPQGVGSTIGFGVTAFISGALGLGAEAGTALMGALPQASQMYREAEAKGGSELQKWGSFIAGLGIGATEAAPIADLMRRWNHTSGGLLSRSFRVGAVQTVEEGVQEGGQTGLENITARATGLDPDRQVDKGVNENTGVGGLTGAIYGAAGGALGGRRAGGAAGIAARQTVPGSQIQPPALPPPGPPAVDTNAPAPVAPAPQPSAPAAPGAVETPEAATPPAPPAEPLPTPALEAPRPAPNVPTDEADLLRGAGYDTEEIGEMSGKERAAAVAEAREQGVEPVAAPPSDEGGAKVEQGGAAAAETAPEAPKPAEAPPLSARAKKAEDLFRQEGKVSTSFLQRKHGLRYNDAATVMEELEKAGVVSAADQNGKRTILPVKAAPGTRGIPVKVGTAEDLATASVVINATPTDGQKKAGNYQKGHVKIAGLEISLENGPGSTRTGKDADGKEWTSKLPEGTAYGYVKGTKGRDKDHLDVFVGPNPKSKRAFIIDQADPDTAEFDEHKIMLGYDSADQAKTAYGQSYGDGKGGLRVKAISEWTPWQLKKWAEIQGRRVKPAADLAQNQGKPPAGYDFVEGEGEKDERPPTKPPGQQDAGQTDSGRKATQDQTAAEGRPSAKPEQAQDGEDVETRLQKLKDQLIGFASGMSRSNDMAAAGWARGGSETAGVGVDINEISKPGLLMFAKQVVDRKVRMFVDSGAFSLFRRNSRDKAKAEKAAADLFAEAGEKKPAQWKAMNFEETMTAYEDLMEAVDNYNEAEEDFPGVLFVMPDIVGDQAGSIELARQWKTWIKAASRSQSVRPVVPIQKGALTLAEAYEQIVQAIDTGEFIVGIPSNEKAVSNAELRAFIEEVKPKRIHFLGAVSPKNLDPKLRIIAEAGVDLDHLSADANVLRSQLYGQSLEGKDRPSAVADKLKTPETELEEAGLTVTVRSSTKEELARNLPKFYAAAQTLTPFNSVDAHGDTENEARAKAVAALLKSHRANKAAKAKDKEKDQPLPEPAKAAGPRVRKFSAYTTDQLRETLADGTKRRNMTADQIAAMEEEVRARESGESQVKVTPQITPATAKTPEEGPSKSDKERPLANHFIDYFEEGSKIIRFATILGARNFAKERTGEEDVKKIEEAIEAGLIMAARDYLDAKERTPEEAFDHFVALYKRMPVLGARTSTSMLNQAYSTPLPLAYLASRLAGVTSETTVLEPTAGNGALLIEANPKKASVNELNHDRAQALYEMGFVVTEKDASDPKPGNLRHPGYPVDVVIANPPFGVVKDEKGKSKRFDLSDIQANYETSEIDHAIVFRALASMKPDGRAVLIIGAPNKLAEGGEGYKGKAKREFYLALFRNYRVVDHFTVNGDLYTRQGAGWPVDVIVIQGRGTTDKKLPAVDTPPMLSSWEALKGKLDVRAGDRPSDQAAPGGGNASADIVDGRDRGHAPDVGDDLVAPAEGSAGERGGVRGTGVPADREPGGRQDLEQRPDGGQVGGDGGKTAPERRPPGLVTEDEIGAAFDDALGPAPASSRVETTPRTKAAIAASAATNAIASADAAIDGLIELFGSGKTIGVGPAFDEETYAKAKPLFIQAAQKFIAFKNDVLELVRRIVDEMKARGFPHERIQAMRAYAIRFVQDVKSGSVSLESAPAPAPAPKPAAAKKALPASELTETAHQVTYPPQSKGSALGTLVPTNMQTAASDALAAVEAKHGDIDAYVAKELGYKPEELSKYLAAEQVDALALAFDNMKRGRGFIIGDQTGIGKGRVNAAIIRYAIRNGKIPIFVTAKPNLYGDMYRDLSGIGIQDYLGRDIRIFPTNASGRPIPLNEEETIILKLASSDKQNNTLLQFARNGDIGDHDVVFTTYSQMQPVDKKDTHRRTFLNAIASNAILILDEAHEAGGVKKEREVKGQADDRAKYIRGLVHRASAVFYSSATYAKRPDVMDLYDKTDMGLVVSGDKDGGLGEVIKKGGIPLQQAVASMLAKAGQYVRRERSFHGVVYDTKSAPVDRDTYNKFSASLAAVMQFSKTLKPIVKKISNELAGAGSNIAHDGSTGGAGAASTNFTSVMHNLINQFLLSITSDATAVEAIDSLRAGEKPVITVSNTAESFIADYAAEMGLNPGDATDLTFKNVLHRYLERARWYTERKPFMKKGEKGVRVRLTDAELGPEGRAAFKAAQDVIEQMNVEGLPVSPIDYIKARIKAEGYTFTEITGRNMTLEYKIAGKGNQLTVSPRQKIVLRPPSEQSIPGRLRAIANFNSGAVDVILLNRSGSTGLSLHASHDFKNKSKRHMIIAQAEGNIDTHMQMLGRVHRTGQVVVPRYTQLAANIPATIRPASVLAKKMASLNANTTASRDSALTAKDVPDFMNHIGDQVAVSVLLADPSLIDALDDPIDLDEDEVEDGAMRKLTGRIPLLPIERQEEVYEALQDEYAARLQAMEEAGESPFEAKTLELDAKLLNTMVYKEGKAGSPFTEAVELGTYNVKRLGKPQDAWQMLERLVRGVGLDPEKVAGFAEKNVARVMAAVNEVGRRTNAVAQKQAMDAFSGYRTDYLKTVEHDDARHTAQTTRLDSIQEHFNELIDFVSPGQHVMLKQEDESIVGTIVLQVKGPDLAKIGSGNPLAPGQWRVTFAVPTEQRTRSLSFNQLVTGNQAVQGHVSVYEPSYGDRLDNLLKDFDTLAAAGDREQRIIITGNMLGAFSAFDKGKIINFRTADGEIKPGVMLNSRTRSALDAMKGAPIPLATGKDVLAHLESLNGKALRSTDDVIGLMLDHYEGLMIATDAARATAGKYYLDKDVLDAMSPREFQKRGNTMRADVRKDLKEKVVDALIDAGAVFEREMTNEEAKGKLAKIAPEAVPPDAQASVIARVTPVDHTDAGGRSRINEDAEEEANEIYAMPHFQKAAQEIARLIHRVAGNSTTVQIGLLLRASGTTMKQSGAAGEEQEGLIGGFYSRIRNLIGISMWSSERREHAYHESFHALQALGAMSMQEVALLQKEKPRLEAIIRESGKYPDLRFDNLIPSELHAYAFGIYAIQQENEAQIGGLHIGVRRTFAKILDLWTKIKNLIEGFGFQTHKDVFDRAMSGELARRPRDPATGQALGGFSYSIAPHAPVIQAANQAVGAGPAVARTPTPPSFDMPADTKTVGALRALQEEFIDLRRAQEAIVQTRGFRLPENLDVKLAQELYPGRTSEALEDFDSDYVKPLVEALIAEKVSQADLDSFVYARHAQERNYLMSQRDPGVFGADGGSGMANDAADLIMDDFRNTGRYAAVNRVASVLDSIRDFDRNNRLTGGLISQDTFDEWENAFQHYVPLRGFAEQDENLLPDDVRPLNMPRLGSGFDLRGKESKQALGRKSIAASPTISLIMQAENGIIRVEKNKVNRALMRLARQFPNKAVWEINRVKMIKVLDKASGLVKRIPDPAVKVGENVFVAKIGGAPHYITIHHAGMAQAFRNLSALDTNALREQLSKFTRFYASLQTGRNPEFAIPNILRDVQEAAATAVVEGSQPGGHKFVGKFLKNWPGALLAVSKIMMGRDPGPVWRQAHDEWRRQGGRVSYNAFREFEDIAEDISFRLRKPLPVHQRIARGMREEGKANYLMNTVARSAIVRFIQAISTVSEDTSRFAYDKGAREAGYSPARAASLARESTVNFSRRGSWGPAINAGWMFYNANTQGNVKMVRMIRSSKRFAGAYAALIPLSYLMTTLIRGASDDDDEKGRKVYDLIPQWERESNLIIPTSFAKKALDPSSWVDRTFWRDVPTTKGHMRYFKLPLAFGLKIPWLIGHNAAMVSQGAMKPKDAALHSLAGVLDAFNPVGRGSIVNVFAPTLLDPVADIVANRNWTGRPIHPDRQAWNEGTPNSQMFLRSTHPAYIGVADFLNNATGGGKRDKGFIDLYPDHIRYATEWATGGLGRFIAGGTNTLIRWAQGVDTPPETIPIVRRFVGETNSAGEAARYYELRNEFMAAQGKLRDAKKALEHNPEDATAMADYERFAKEVGVTRGPTSKRIDWEGTPAKVFSRTDKAVGEKNREMGAIRQSSKLTAAERDQKLKALDAEIEDLRRGARKEYRLYRPEP